jgi:hypothetical protein
MNRAGSIVLTAFALWLLIQPANSCGPFFEELVFTRPGIPEREAQYVAGHLGVLQRTYNRRYLIEAYLWLSGRGLDKQEQIQAIPGSAGQNSSGQEAGNWFAPQRVPGAAGQPEKAIPSSESSSENWAAIHEPIARHLPGSQWEAFDNCLVDAFQTAARTYADRRQRYGGDSPETLDWVRGQHAVFENCGGEHPTTVLPEPAEAKASLWLRQDRAYQTASAQFYATDYPAARQAYDAIAQDRVSPWRALASYLAVRSLVRQATLTPEGKPSDPALLLEAERRLRQLIADPGMQPLLPTLNAYLGYVALRAHPDDRAVELARRLNAPQPDPTLGQDLTDLLYYFDQNPENQPARDKNELIDWVKSVNNNEPDHALAMWRRTHSTAWLIAVLTLTGTPAASEKDQKLLTLNAELVTAAQAVPADSPGFLAATYHRLRLNPSAPASLRQQLDQILPAIQKTEARSEINLFLKMRAATAPTLDAYLQDAARAPSGLETEGEVEDDSPNQAGPNAKLLVCGRDVLGTPDEPGTHRRFDADAALILNRRLPLSEFALAGLSTELPQPLRFETALAAWSRAVLLGQPEVAAKLSAALESCQPGLEEWLAKYDNSKTADERRINGLFALMRFPAMRPYVNQGAPRDDDFAAYDILRDNWWCEDVIPTGTGIGYQRGDSPDPPNPEALEPNPPFLSRASSGEAARELAALSKVGSAPDYFAAQALQWEAAHPTDPRNADLLGFAKRVIRNGCRTKASSEWDHKLFLKLQHKYPNSTWAKKYTTWE